MIPHSAITLQTFLALITFKEVVGGNQRCYICIPNIGSSITDVTQMFPSGPSLPLCNQFQVGKKEFIRECPSAEYVGCLTQTNGTHVTKTCSDIDIQDCKTANNVKYCYCKGDLCNKESVPTEAPRPPVTIPDMDAEGDDESMEDEGSGSSYSSLSTITTTRKLNATTTTTTTNDDIRIDNRDNVREIENDLPNTTDFPVVLTPSPTKAIVTTAKGSANVIAQSFGYLILALIALLKC